MLKLSQEREKISLMSDEEIEAALVNPPEKNKRFFTQLFCVEAHKRGIRELITDIEDSPIRLDRDKYNIYKSDPNYEMGLAYYKNSNFEKAYFEWSIASKNKNILASTMLSIMNIRNLIPVKSYQNAKDRLEAGLKENFPLSAIALCEVYAMGYSTLKNLFKVDELLMDYESAIQDLCNLDNADCQSLYGSILWFNSRNDKDIDLAFRMLLAAADNGNIEAQAELAIIGIEKTYFYEEKERGVNALKEISQKADIPCVNRMLGEIYLDPYEDISDLKKGYELISSAAKAGDIIAGEILGDMYFQGIYVERDLKQAEEIYKELLERADCAWANLMLGRIYATGSLGKKNVRLAINHLKFAMNGQAQKANYYMGQIYLYDKDLKDLNKAKEFYEKSAKSRNPNALYKLGFLYLHPDADFFNVDKSIEYLKESAQLGNPDANNILGKLYLDGVFIKKDTLKAFECFQKGFENLGMDSGIEIAKMMLEGKGMERNREGAMELLLDIDGIISRKPKPFFSMCLANAMNEYACNKQELKIAMKHYIKAYEGGIKEAEEYIMILCEIENMDASEFAENKNFYNELLKNLGEKSRFDYDIIEAANNVNQKELSDFEIAQAQSKMSVIRTSSEHPTLMYAFLAEKVEGKADAKQDYIYAIEKERDSIAKGIFRRKYLYKCE